MAKSIDKRQFRIRRKEITTSDWMGSNFVRSEHIGRTGFLLEEKGLFFWRRAFGICSSQEQAEKVLTSFIAKEVDKAAFLHDNPNGVVAYASLMNGFERLN